MGILDAPARNLGPRIAQAQLVRGVPVLGNLGTLDRLSNGTDTGHNGRRRCIVNQDCTDLRFVYGNFYNNENTATTNPITVRAAVMNGNADGRFWPLYFGGVRDVTIQPGQTIISDPVSADFAAGQAIFITTYVTATAGNKWPLGQSADTSVSEYNTSGTSEVDRTTTTAWPGASANGGRIFAPLACYGTTAKGYQPVVAAVGDSIINGSNDPVQRGYLPRALNDAIPYVSVSMGGENGYQFFGKGAVGTENQGRLRRQLLTGCTHAVEGYGHNDLAAGVAVSTIQAALIAGWRSLKVRGIKVYRTTILPDTSSTDSWATTANQTPQTWNGNRVTLNDWIRDGAPMDGSFNPLATGSNAAGTIRAGNPAHPLAGYFETADVVETARNSGLWKVNGTANWYTNDGTHPTTAGHTALAAAIDTSKFKV